MILCLSSSFHRRYRDDIYGGLSMAEGMGLQFRYQDKYLPPSLVNKFRDGGHQLNLGTTEAVSARQSQLLSLMKYKWELLGLELSIDETNTLSIGADV